MPVEKRKHSGDYTLIPNELIRDERLSCRDLGLLVWMLSKPKEWQFSYQGILHQLKLDGKGSIQSGVKNLQTAGYLTIKQERTKGRIGDTTWNVTDTPYPKKPHPEKPHPENRDYSKERYSKERINNI